jgi:hypothetical protein
MGISTSRIYKVNKEHGWIIAEFQNLPTLEEWLIENPDQKKLILDTAIDFIITM